MEAAGNRSRFEKWLMQEPSAIEIQCASTISHRKVDMHADDSMLFQTTAARVKAGPTKVMLTDCELFIV